MLRCCLTLNGTTADQSPPPLFPPSLRPSQRLALSLFPSPSFFVFYIFQIPCYRTELGAEGDDRLLIKFFFPRLSIIDLRPFGTCFSCDSSLLSLHLILGFRLFSREMSRSIFCQLLFGRLFSFLPRHPQGFGPFDQPDLLFFPVALQSLCSSSLLPVCSLAEIFDLRMFFFF